MYGFDNITANNGWAIAVIGASIVFAGLVILSFVISQIHKVLELWDRRIISKERQKEVARPERTPPPGMSSKPMISSIANLQVRYVERKGSRVA